MIIAFLREFKREFIKKNNLADLEYVMLSEYVLKFLEFYGVRFDVNTKEIDMTRGGQIQEKFDKSHNGFSVKYTDNNDINIGSQAFKIRDVFACFRNRFNFIKNYNFRSNESVLKYLINPSDQSFDIYYKKS
jgi:non-canonical poly(A) RNA polymerase PAPD5/7